MKRFIISCVILSAALIGVIGMGAETASPFVIAIVKETGVEQYDSAVDGFREVIEKDNKNTRFNMYDPEDRFLIHKIKTLKPNLILTVGASVTNMIANEIKDIPVIFSMIMDPKGSQVSSKNIIGASMDVPVRIQLETMRFVLPNAKRIGVIYNPAENEAIAQEARIISNELGLILKTYPVNSEREIPGLGALPIDVLWIIPDNTVCKKQAVIIRFLTDGIKNKIAVMGFSRFYARAGALFAVSCDYKDVGRQSGELALKLVKGEKYSDLKISAPRIVKLYLSRIAAEKLDIIFPEALIKKASEVF